MHLHEELNRLLLRARWIKWSTLHYLPGDYDYPSGRHVVLSRRLTRAKPTWDERHPPEHFIEMDGCL